MSIRKNPLKNKIREFFNVFFAGIKKLCVTISQLQLIPSLVSYSVSSYRLTSIEPLICQRNVSVVILYVRNLFFLYKSTKIFTLKIGTALATMLMMFKATVAQNWVKVIILVFYNSPYIFVSVLSKIAWYMCNIHYCLN